MCHRIQNQLQIFVLMELRTDILDLQNTLLHESDNKACISFCVWCQSCCTPLCTKTKPLNP